MNNKLSFILLVYLYLAVSQVVAGNGIMPGELVVEPPTLICLGFEWSIAAGDDNRNSSVELSYRRSGDSDWKPALPLLRLGGERVFEEYVYLDYTVPQMFAGSILDLEPDTEYECLLVMKDPDGVKGKAERRVKVRTRAVPEACPDGRVLHVYPPGYEGQREEPSFTGIKKAYYGSGGGDWSVVSERTVMAGDIILVHAGLYKGQRLNYSDPLGLPFDGTYVLAAKGTAERPITIKAAGDGEVIFDGDGCFRLFDVMAADYHIFEGLTIRNTDIAFYAGLKDVAGCSGLAVKNCRMENVGIGVNTQYAGSKNFYIADNTILGREDPYRLIGWFHPGEYGAPPLTSYYGVKVYGSGHVVCHNYIAYFHDAVCVCTHGSPDRANKCVAIDFYNNDIHMMGDDFIETDGGVHNIRVMRNRCFNAAQCGLSAQPVFGGPAYFIRNILYNVPWGVAFKFECQPSGLYIFHNTIIAENRKGPPHGNVRMMNNLLVGTGKSEYELQRLCNNTSYSAYDYNGYRPNEGEVEQFVWSAPQGGKLVDYSIDRTKGEKYRSLSEFSKATGQEKHGILVDYDIFAEVSAPDPKNIYAVYAADKFDFSLTPSGSPVDAGIRLPNINDDFMGSAPDMGALELGGGKPVYGPRF